MNDFIATLDSDHDTIATPVVGSGFRHLNQQLLERFFRNVQIATGKWVYHGYRWHAYTFNYEPAISGDAAFHLYRTQSVQPFYIYHEFDDLLYDCISASWPDIRTFNNDIYLVPHDMAWLFTTTHEMSMGLGPFFSTPSV